MGFYSRGETYRLYSRHGAMSVNRLYQYDHVIGKWHYWIAGRSPRELIADRANIEKHSEQITSGISDALDMADYKCGTITFPVYNMLSATPICDDRHIGVNQHHINLNISVAR